MELNDPFDSEILEKNKGSMELNRGLAEDFWEKKKGSMEFHRTFSLRLLRK